ncbi:hypothetical protein Agabi119p4_600 [Agaricus bisporus var. burnettii]|uniref:Uncharacterized protein n=1 Tax=Agaricus bisporus var. burnettii TaxID=192524 RepID=A0A8H7KKY1_AGABI|nr:hypothetical protein Agabi119p4_600 [Agaricus bisporus var. burnettii]
MTSTTSLKCRRRSRSASVTSSTARRSPDSPLRIAAKRAHPVHSVTPINHNLGTRKWDIDEWRRGKRRRCDPSSSENISIGFFSEQEQVDFSHSVTPMMFSFPTSSADFNLFPKSECSPRRRASYSQPGPDDRLSGMELTRLRSNAFWELHKSVAENGEGFVQRMRDYERARSRRTLGHTRKGQKRMSNVHLNHSTSSHFGSDIPNDNDDIQIVAGEDWPISLDDDFQQRSEFCSDDSRFAAPVISTPFAWSVDEDYPESTYSDPLASASTFSPSCTPPSSLSSAQSFTFDGHAPIFSVPPSPPSLNGQASVSSEKALSELSLAFASGAGSINDYDHLQNLTEVDSEAMDEGGPGELWH